MGRNLSHALKTNMSNPSWLLNFYDKSLQPKQGRELS